MSENTTEELAMQLDTHFRPPNAEGGAELRQVVLGYEPLILVRVNMDASAEDLIAVELDATGFDAEEAADFLVAVIEGLRRIAAENPTT